MQSTAPEDGTIRDFPFPKRGDPGTTDDSETAGPEGDTTIEIDFVRGRSSVDLESLQEDGPELDPNGIDVVDPIEHFDLTWLDQRGSVPIHEEELGPELDLEHVLEKASS